MKKLHLFCIIAIIIGSVFGLVVFNNSIATNSYNFVITALGGKGEEGTRDDFTEVNISAETSDGQIRAVNKASWSDARDASSGDNVDTSSSYLADAVYAINFREAYSVARTFFTFNTSSIPDNAVINNITFYVKGITNTFGDVVIVKSTHGDTLSSSDYNNVDFGTAYSDEYDSWTTSGYNAIPLTVKSFLNLTGMSKFALIDHDYDYLNSTPIFDSAKVGMYFSDNITYEPYLQITYSLNSAPNAPSVNSPVNDSVGQELTVYLNVTVTDDDGDAMNVSFYNNATDAQIGSTQTSVSNGTTAQVTWSGLSAGTTYTWYVNVTDGTATTKSSIWNFKTLKVVTDCQTITESGKYILTSSLNGKTTSSCINIDVADVFFDCQGYTIDGNDIADYAIDIYGETYDNVNISNCVLNDWDNYAIRVYSADNIYIKNVTTTSLPDSAISITGSSNNINIFNSSLTVGSNDYGVYIYNTPTDISIIDTNISYGYYGIYIRDASAVILKNIYSYNAAYFAVYFKNPLSCNTIFENVSTQIAPIVFYNTSTSISNWNNNVSGIILCDANNSLLNNISIEGVGTLKNGIILTATKGNVLENITINNSKFKNSRQSIVADVQTLKDIIISNNVFNSTESNAIVLVPDLTVGNLKNINISNNSFISTGFRALDLSYSNDSVISNNFFYDCSIAAIYASGNNNLSIFSNKINDSGYCLYVGGNVKFFNNLCYTPSGAYFVSGGGTNEWNISLQLGDRVIGDGVYIGGNAWINESGNNGFYYTCIDTDTDGICDEDFDVVNKDNNCSGVTDCDYAPLSNKYLVASDLSFNITIIGETVVSSSDPASSTNDIEFNSSGSSQSNVEPCVVDGSCQVASSTLSIFTFTNDGNKILNWTICLNDSMPNSINITCSSTNNHASAVDVPVCSSGNLTLGDGITTGTSVKGYCWSDFMTALASDTTQRMLTHSAIEDS